MELKKPSTPPDLNPSPLDHEAYYRPLCYNCCCLSLFLVSAFLDSQSERSQAKPLPAKTLFQSRIWFRPLLMIYCCRVSNFGLISFRRFEIISFSVISPRRLIFNEVLDERVALNCSGISVINLYGWIVVAIIN